MPSHGSVGWSLALVLVAVSGQVCAEEVVVTMADPFSITCVNPARPSLGEGAPGGLDAGLIGDSDRVLLGDHDVGKQFYGANDAATIHFRATGPVVVKLGLWLSQWGSPRGEALLDGQKVRDFVGRASPDRAATETFDLAGTGALQALTIRPAAGVGGYVHLDALAFSAAGKVEILDPAGRPALVSSSALSPGEAQALQAAMTRDTNLALAGDKMSYEATEEFASAADGDPQYGAAAALNGDPKRSYWAGGTAPPHALVLTWKQPVTLTHNRILWLGENRGLWYGLEAWDGARWRLLYEERRNLQPDPVYRFPAVTTTRVRFTTYSVNGQQRMLMSAFELYNLPAGGGGQ